MSSEGSQLGSSIGEQKSNMSCDGSSANSSIRPSIHDAAQGLAYLAMLASRECAPLYSGSTYDHGSTPFQPPEHAENFRRGPARAAAGRGPSSAGFNEGRTAPHAAMINGKSYLGFCFSSWGGTRLVRLRSSCPRASPLDLAHRRI